MSNSSSRCCFMPRNINAKKHCNYNSDNSIYINYYCHQIKIEKEIKRVYQN